MRAQIFFRSLLRDFPLEANPARTQAIFDNMSSPSAGDATPMADRGLVT